MSQNTLKKVAIVIIIVFLAIVVIYPLAFSTDEGNVEPVMENVE